MSYDETRHDDLDRRGGEVAEAERPQADAKPRERERDDGDARSRPSPGRGAGDRDQPEEHDGKGDENGDGNAEGKDVNQQKTKRRSPLPWIILAAVIVAGAVGGTLWWLSVKDLASTDDAYTDGRAITITPKVSGYVAELRVNDNQRVHAGDLLVQIDPRDFVTARDQARANLEIARAQRRGSEFGAQIARKNFPARLAQAQAQLAQAKAQLFQAQTEYSRQHGVSRAATTQQSIDTSTANLQAAQANVAAAEATVQQAMPVQQNIDQTDQQVSQQQGQVDQAQAQLDQAELNLSYSRVVAPQDGWITRRNVERGNYATAGSSIMSVVSPEVWVTANFKETQLNRMRPGQPVDVSVDAYPGLKLKCHVDSVQLGSGARFSAFPAENATGNFVKIVRRVPVKIVCDSGFDPSLPLPLGVSVTPTVHLK